MIKAGEAEKLHIAIVGRKNVGKSLLINRIVSHELFIVNDIPERTSEPLSKVVELLPYGPVVIIDTAGIDNDEFNNSKINKTMKAISYADFAILVLDAREELDKAETELITYLRKIDVPFLIVVNKIEFGVNPQLLIELEALEVTHFEVSCKENVGIENFKKKLIHLLPGEEATPLIKDCIGKGEVVVLVIPDNFDELPGQIFKSQLQDIQKELGRDTINLVVKENELAGTLSKLKNLPALVIADTRAIGRIKDDLPDKVKLTTYAILAARQRGNLTEYAKGVKKVKELENGDLVLVSEGCKNHLQEFDFDKMNIQEWLKINIKSKLKFHFSNGCGLPDNLPDYKLIIHCDGCSIPSKIMRSRIRQAKLMNIPIVNYSVLISYLNGVFPKTILPFKEAISA